MRFNWSAVLAGFAVTLVLGFISGLAYEGASATAAGLYWGVIGAVGGITAGYLAGGTIGNGALQGGMATVVGSVVLVVVATFTTLLFGGLVASLGVLTLGVLLLAFYAIPGAVGGAVGSWVKGRRAVAEAAGTRT